MAKGGVRSFEGLVDAVGENSPVDGVPTGAGPFPRPSGARSVPVRDLVGNPHNPRDSVGNLDELASIVDFQLQPVVVVTRDAYQRLYPDAAIATRWVVVIGNRRLAAAVRFGRPELDVMVKDELARDRGTLLTAIIAENVDRSGFDVIEEAKAVEQLVGEYGNLGDAAEHLRKSKAWISQRRALLKLAPELQQKLRDGDLAIREARALACVPQAEQVRRWRAAAEKHVTEDADSEPAPTGAPADTATTRAVTRALRKFDGEPSALALALRDYLGESGTRALASGLRKLLK